MFMLQFPLYLAAKQAGSRLEDLTQVEATSLAVFLDVTGLPFLLYVTVPPPGLPTIRLPPPLILFNILFNGDFPFPKFYQVHF
jgi:hypothetical protein